MMRCRTELERLVMPKAPSLSRLQSDRRSECIVGWRGLLCGTVLAVKWSNLSLKGRATVDMETVNAWLSQPATRELLRELLPGTPIALAILCHGILTRTGRSGVKVVTPNKRAQARIT